MSVTYYSIEFTPAEKTIEVQDSTPLPIAEVERGLLSSLAARAWANATSISIQREMWELDGDIKNKLEVVNLNKECLEALKDAWEKFAEPGGPRERMTIWMKAQNLINQLYDPKEAKV